MDTYTQSDLAQIQELAREILDIVALAQADGDD